MGLGNSCGACKFLRRKCTSECVFAPCFSYEHAATHFSAVHKVFGASNVSKLLSRLPPHSRGCAATTVSYEALARMRDPVYGCVAHIYALQQQIVSLQEEIANEMIGNCVIGINNSSGSSPESNNMPFYSTHQLSQLPDSGNSNLFQNQLFDEHMNSELPLSEFENDPNSYSLEPTFCIGNSFNVEYGASLF